MEDIMNIFKRLQAVSGTKEKEKILKQNQNNEEFTTILEFLLNPFAITGVKKKKLDKMKKSNKKFNIVIPDSIFPVLEYLKHFNTGREEDVYVVAEFLKSIENEELREFYEQIILKSFRTGAKAKVVNKAFNQQFIPIFEIMAAQKFEDNEIKVKGQEFILTEKLDGSRIITHKENDEVKLFSRQGKLLEGYTELTEQLQRLPDGVYDGEVLIANEDNYSNRDVFQETQKITSRKGEKTGIVYHMFDGISVEELNRGKSKIKFFERKNRLIEILEELNSDIVTYVPNLYEGKDMSVIPDMLENVNTQGKEGLMLNLDAPYECKRSGNILKLKVMDSSDVFILDVEEGEGKFEGMLGNLVVNYKGNELRVGSGFSEKERSEIWRRPLDYIGNIAEIQHFRESKDKYGNVSVSFPVYLRTRVDKTEESYN